MPRDLLRVGGLACWTTTPRRRERECVWDISRGTPVKIDLKPVGPYRIGRTAKSRQLVLAPKHYANRSDMTPASPP